MARPRKSEDEKLVPAKVTLAPDRFDQLDREARRRDLPLAVVIRERIDQSFREPKTHT
jgi:hypothetical protein